MTNCYIDDTSLSYTQEASKTNFKIPNVHILGGIIIPSSEEEKIIQLIKATKSKYTHPNLPIKWNMKDNSISDIYKRFNRDKELEKLLKDSNTWRHDIFLNSLDINYLIIISCIENYQIENKNQQPIRENISAYLFANILMRIGLHAKNQKIKNMQIIFDWPPANNPKPYNDEYYYAYNGGISTSRIKYYSGKLCDLEFKESIHYTKCTHSTMLQFCDLVIGAFKDSIESRLKKESAPIGKELSNLIISKLDGYPYHIKGRGINVSSQNLIFKKLINKIIETYVP